MFRHTSNSCCFQRDAGRQQLLHCLGWPPLSDEDDDRRSIHLDVLYDSLMFCAEKGFSWDHISPVLIIVDQMIQETKGELRHQIMTPQKTILCTKVCNSFTWRSQLAKTCRTDPCSFSRVVCFSFLCRNANHGRHQTPAGKM